MDRRPDEKTPAKPVGKLFGTYGNVIEIIWRVRQVLRNAGQPERASEFVHRASRTSFYDEVLRLCMEYVEVNGCDSLQTTSCGS
jgi:hypothetical protein